MSLRSGANWLLMWMMTAQCRDLH